MRQTVTAWRRIHPVTPPAAPSSSACLQVRGRVRHETQPAGNFGKQAAPLAKWRSGSAAASSPTLPGPPLHLGVRLRLAHRLARHLLKEPEGGRNPDLIGADVARHGADTLWQAEERENACRRTRGSSPGGAPGACQTGCSAWEPRGPPPWQQQRASHRLSDEGAVRHAFEGAARHLPGTRRARRAGQAWARHTT